jgi:hypothetical protein
MMVSARLIERMCIYGQHLNELVVRRFCSNAGRASDWQSGSFVESDLNFGNAD